MKGGHRDNDQEGTPYPFRLRDVRHEGNSLDGFTKTHLVSENAVNTLLVKIVEPPQPSQLILLQLCIQNTRGLYRLLLLVIRIEPIDVQVILMHNRGITAVKVL